MRLVLGTVLKFATNSVLPTGQAHKVLVNAFFSVTLTIGNATAPIRHRTEYWRQLQGMPFPRVNDGFIVHLSPESCPFQDDFSALMQRIPTNLLVHHKSPDRMRMFAFGQGFVSTQTREMLSRSILRHYCDAGLGGSNTCRRLYRTQPFPSG